MANNGEDHHAVSRNQAPAPTRPDRGNPGDGGPDRADRSTHAHLRIRDNRRRVSGHQPGRAHRRPGQDRHPEDGHHQGQGQEAWLDPLRAPVRVGAGPRALRLDQDGNEVFKAYPDKMAKGKVLSMHAMGDVVTTKGIWARGLGATERPGSSLDQIKAAYPTVN